MSPDVAGAGIEGGLVRADAVLRARDRIRPYVLRTPVVPMFGHEVRCKAENLQASGSFKVRGAFNTVLQLTDAQRRSGIVAHSSGNHAIAVAMVGRVLDVATTVVVPSDAPAVKIDRTRALGATVEVVGPASSERAERATQIAATTGATLVEPYDSDAVIEATASIALEAFEDVPEAGAPIGEVYVPVSGGGLAAGVALGTKMSDPGVRVIGVEPEVAADALASRRAGRRVELPAEQMARTIADGLRVQRVGARPWVHLEALLDDLVTVTEDEIRAAMGAVASEAALVAEPSGATAVAAAIAGHGSGVAGRDRLAVVTGGNVELDRFCSLTAAVR